MSMTTVAAMKNFLGLLLFSLLLPQVAPIICYVCSSSSTNEQCNQNNQTCPAPLDTCMTIIDVQGSSKAIVKQCASRATCLGAASTAFVDEDGNGNTVNCCSSHNLCNFSGTRSLSSHTVLPVLPLLLLLLGIR